MKRVALTLLLVALTTTAAAQTPTSRATDVRDGDTIELRTSTSKALTT
jgi:endonuclease YncB( thermonuclease family)